jgi:hypothetical protein
VQYGESLTQFMDEKIPESDFVLIICTPTYAVKSVQRQGGVGYEAQIVSARIAASIPRSKFVPVIRAGEPKPGAPDCAMPPHFQGIGRWICARRRNTMPCSKTCCATFTAGLGSFPLRKPGAEVNHNLRVCSGRPTAKARPAESYPSD